MTCWPTCLNKLPTANVPLQVHVEPPINSKYTKSNAYHTVSTSFQHPAKPPESLEWFPVWRRRRLREQGIETATIRSIKRVET